GDACVDGGVRSLEGIERSLGEADGRNLPVADGIAGFDQGQSGEMRGASSSSRHGARSLISCRTCSKLEGSSSKAIWPRNRSNPFAISASPRANSSLAAFGGATPDQNWACSSTWRSIFWVIGPSKLRSRRFLTLRVYRRPAPAAAHISSARWRDDRPP